MAVGSSLSLNVILPGGDELKHSLEPERQEAFTNRNHPSSEMPPTIHHFNELRYRYPIAIEKYMNVLVF